MNENNKLNKKQAVDDRSASSCSTGFVLESNGNQNGFRISKGGCEKVFTQKELDTFRESINHPVFYLEI